MHIQYIAKQFQELLQHGLRYTHAHTRAHTQLYEENILFINSCYRILQVRGKGERRKVATNLVLMRYTLAGCDPGNLI